MPSDGALGTISRNCLRVETFQGMVRAPPGEPGIFPSESTIFQHASKSFRQKIERRLPNCEASGSPVCDLQEESAVEAEAEVQPTE